MCVPVLYLFFFFCVSLLRVITPTELAENIEVDTVDSAPVRAIPECHIKVPLDGDTANIVQFSERQPERVDYVVHQWCSQHRIYDSDGCNQLRNYFLSLCHPSFLDTLTGPIYMLKLPQYDTMYNLQMRKDDANIDITIDRFCANHIPKIDASSKECEAIKSTLADEDFLSLPVGSTATSLLDSLYQAAVEEPSDVQHHMADHFRLAVECEVVMEIGVRGMVSTWGILKGLLSNNKSIKKYIGVDLYYPTALTWKRFVRVCDESAIDCTFLEQNDMTIEHSQLPPSIDMLFIDALHTYCHVMYELTTFAPLVSKYIALHDTSEPWGAEDEPYSGDYSEYPDSFDKSKRGVFTAVQDFLAANPTEWMLKFRKVDSNGYTLLVRVGAPTQYL